MNRFSKAAMLAAAAGTAVLATAGAASAHTDSQTDGQTGLGGPSSTANGVAAGSPGVVSGNVIQLPINVPVNACGDTINVIGLLNPAEGNTCANL